jgi:hypothetical protein
MATEVRGTLVRRSSLGYAVVLLGAVLFMTSCFLPYTGFLPTEAQTISLVEQLTLPGGASDLLSALLYLFGGVATVAAVATVALVRGGRGPALPFLLVGAVAAWSLTWIGILLQYGSPRLFSLEFGFWLQAASIGVVVIGTILVVLGKRSQVKDSHDRDANEEGVDVAG